MRKDGFKKDLPALPPREMFSWLVQFQLFEKLTGVNLFQIVTVRERCRSRKKNHL